MGIQTNTYICKLKTIMLIERDSSTLLSIAETEHDPNVCIGMLPYYSLFYTACDDFLCKNAGMLRDGEIGQEIRLIRNEIKKNADGYRKICRRLIDIDEKNDILFKEYVLSDYFKEPIFYDNLGIQFVDKKHPVVNTYEAYSYTGYDGNRAFEIAKEIGSFIKSVNSGFSELIKTKSLERPRIGIGIPYYYDTNTHRVDAFFRDSENVEENLFFLNILCSINFVVYILNELLDEENSWLFRMKFVSAHHAAISLQRLKNYMQNSGRTENWIGQLNSICERSKELANPILRNSMMHYQFPVTGSETINKSDPLLGLIEDCGITEGFFYYSGKLDQILMDISEFLGKMFDTEGIRLNRF